MIYAISIFNIRKRMTSASGGQFSWLYQYEIMKSTPEPKHCITVRFEDAITNWDETFAQVEAFLGFPLGKVIVRPDSVGRWKTDDGVHDFEFLHPAMKAYQYI